VTRPVYNLFTGGVVAVALAGALYVATLTTIGLWRYLLAVTGLGLFLFGGLLRRSN
jgi:hypothetical protein